jgi:azurin
MHAVAARFLLFLSAVFLAAQCSTPAGGFKFDRAPLDPAAHPWHSHPVNRDRVYDFYAKQARYALSQRPRPETLPPFPGLDGGTYGHWGNQNEETWEDGRWNGMDVGTVQAGVFRGWGHTIARAVCVRLGDRGEMSACFDPDTLTWKAAWTGGFVRFSPKRKGFLSGCEPAGTLVDLAAEPAAAAGSFTYHGFYRHGSRVIFHYTRDGASWLDSAWCQNGKFVRTRVPAGTEPLAALTKAAPAQWPQVLETKGSFGTGTPYAVDTLTLPKETPWHSLFHLGDHDFFANGDAAVCTIEGEVWLVRGIDSSLEHLRWKRFAAGLHEALGLKIADGKVYVLGRDQITLLHDTNGDDEADYYECFSNAYQTSPAGHDFITGLQRDSEGRFLFTSSNQGVCRISRDGRSAEVLATGFRNPDGLGLGPRGEIITAVQEGEWTPASMLAEIKPGGHYGYRGPQPGPLGHVLPLIYLPRGLDNSCGGQVFVEGTTWGVPEGSLVHLSFGVGAAYLIIRDRTNPAQAAAIPLPGEFSSGAHRGRFHPKDGQLYVTGTAGWGTYTPDDGCFQRLRYAGGAVSAPIGFEARENGILLSFAEPVDAALASQAGSWFAQGWNYRYGPAYGSDEFSLRNGQPGHDVLEVTSVQVLKNERELFIEIPQLQTANTLHIYSAALPLLSRDLYFTLHNLGRPFTEFPGYRAVAKAPQHQHHDMPSTPATAAPLPVEWEKGTPGRALRIETTTGLQYAQRELRVKAGEHLSLTVENPDVMPHNWVLGARGAVERITDLANKLVTDPNAVARHYVPDVPEVLVHTRIIEPANSTTIHFDAPKEPGDYPYLCTFPGHASIMRGVMRVE